MQHYFGCLTISLFPIRLDHGQTIVQETSNVDAKLQPREVSEKFIWFCTVH